jgi:hypothetical protein
MDVDVLGEMLAAAAAELDSWAPGDGLTDGFLEVRRTRRGFVVCDREAAPPRVRAVTREEAYGFVVAIRGARPRLSLLRS